jgi:diguanylate cyclase (GGDEF)-like protein/PAS domain S-box-containing protein
MLPRLSPNEISQVFSSLPVAICLIGRDLNYLATNDKFSLLLGSSKLELVGVSMANYCPPSLVEKAEQDFRTIDNGDTVDDHEIEYRGRHYLVSVSPVTGRNCSNPIAISVTLTDITVRKALESGLEKSNRDLSAAYRQIKNLSETDPLTGLLNRRGQDKIFETEIRRARRENLPLAVLIIDIDWFKAYNDHYGHLAGDMAIEEVASAIRRTSRRPGDWAIRYGGEEFLVILTNTSEDGALHVATGISQAILNLKIEHARSPFAHLSVSIGTASTWYIPRDASIREISEALISRADEALYRAKKAGRNRIAVATQTA